MHEGSLYLYLYEIWPFLIGQLDESHAVKRPIVAGSKGIANLRLHFISELKRLTATSQAEYINGNVFRTIGNSKIEVVSLGQYTMWQEGPDMRSLQAKLDDAKRWALMRRL